MAGIWITGRSTFYFKKIPMGYCSNVFLQQQCLHGIQAGFVLQSFVFFQGTPGSHFKGHLHPISRDTWIPFQGNPASHFKGHLHPISRDTCIPFQGTPGSHFKGHLDPILEHFNPAFTNRFLLEMVHERVLKTYSSQIAQQGIWHLQKTIAKLIAEILYLQLTMKDKKYIVQGTIMKAKKHFGPKLLHTTINNFYQCIDNLWENHKSNQQIISHLREDLGPNWFREEFKEYSPNTYNPPKKNNVSLQDFVKTTNSKNPHWENSHFP